MFKYMVVGAHPDDCESVAGIMLKLLDLGHRVRFLTATNGCSGHHKEMGGAMAARRRGEADAVASFAGLEYEMLDFNDGELTAGIPERKAMIRAIREFAPDVVITHRPWDYHPDHRNTATLVQDCSYLIQVPNICPLTKVLRYMPAIFHMQDGFKKPIPFAPDLVFDIDGEMQRKMRMYHLYTSQMYEWLPWVAHESEEVPKSDEARFEWLKRTRFEAWSRNYAERFRSDLIQKYGEKGETIKYAEALERSEYGAQPDAVRQKELFPF